MKYQRLLFVFGFFSQVCCINTCASSISSFLEAHHLRPEIKEKIVRGVSFAQASFQGKDWNRSPSADKSVIIAFHGLGDFPHRGYDQQFSQLSGVDIFVPQMPYSSNYLRNNVGAVSMGGIIDLVAALAILKKMSDVGYTKIGLYGFSCGGAVVLNMLHALQEHEKYKDIFAALAIDPVALKEKIKGCIADRPFSSYQCSVEANRGKFVGFFVGLYGYRDVVNLVFNKDYKGNLVALDGVEPLEAVSSIKDVPLFLHGAANDSMVGINGIVKMHNTLQQKNPLTFVQSPGGHLSPISQHLKNAWTDFLKKYLK